MNTLEKYIGYRERDYATPYAAFYDEAIAAVPTRVTMALHQLPNPTGALPAVQQAPDLMLPGYHALETGFTIQQDGSARVAILTEMPGVTPSMWDWWFGWHGDKANKYKLWHPKAHREARWKDGHDDLVAYVGRTSLIEEYIGEKMEKAAIRFISPTELGFDPIALEDKNKVVVICARIGYSGFPLDFGWLVHQIRAVEGGAEMRSRFWMGGDHIAIRGRDILPEFARKILAKVQPVKAAQGHDILVHCSEEMNHLAAFLPQLYHQFYQK